MIRSGRMQQQRAAVQALVRAHPHSNARELAAYAARYPYSRATLGADETARYHAIMRRIGECHDIASEPALFGRGRRYYMRETS